MKSSIIATLVTAYVSAAIAWAEPVVVVSPDETIKAELSDDAGVLRYRILVDGKQVLSPSLLGIRSDDVELGREVKLGAVKRATVNEQYRLFGAKSQAVNHANLATVSATAGGQSYEVDLHVADDGVGVRLRLPAKPGRKVQADRSTWKFESNPLLWAAKWEPGHEETYASTHLDQLTDQPYDLMMTARVDSVYLFITEAAVKDYGELALKRSSEGALEGFLINDPKGWSTDAAVAQPWRVTVIARDLTTLVNSTLVPNLNPPADPELADASWIVPGRCAWQWMAIGAPKPHDQRQWVDWTREMGFEYYLVDEGWSAWPDAWETLASVCAYAKQQNVKIWVWVHSKEVKTPEARQAYFEKVVQCGAVGVKIDFPPPANHWWSTWYHDAARDAARHKLMVNFHGAAKPTGMERTWPNELTREAVRGHEWHITRYKRILDPAHDTILPFTRYVAGHGDYTPTVFETKELQGNTWAHELAQALIFTSPFLCTGGHPKDYVANPAKDVLSAIPAVWDETRVLPGSEPGKIVAMARRRGSAWFVGVINGGSATKLEISCDFLGDGTWRMISLGDAPDKDDTWDRAEREITRADTLRRELRPQGGFVAWFRHR